MNMVKYSIQRCDDCSYKYIILIYNNIYKPVVGMLEFFL